MVIYVVFYVCLFGISLINSYLLKMKLEAIGKEKSYTSRCQRQFLITFWTIVIMLSVLAYVYQEQLVEWPVVVGAGIVVIIFTVLAVKRLNNWMKN